MGSCKLESHLLHHQLWIAVVMIRLCGHRVVQAVDDLSDAEDNPAGMLVQQGAQAHLLLVGDGGGEGDADDSKQCAIPL